MALASRGGNLHIPSRYMTPDADVELCPLCADVATESLEIDDLRTGRLADGDPDGDPLLATEGVFVLVIQETCDGPWRTLSSAREDG